MQRAINIKSESRDIDSNGYNTQGSNRGQKEIIIRKNSSKKLINRPTSQGGSHLNTREDPGANYNKKKAGASQKQGFVLQNTNAIENSLLNNSSYIGIGSNINSPVNNSNAINLQNQRS